MAETDPSSTESPRITLDKVSELYLHYGNDLLEARSYLADLVASQDPNDKMRTQFDDLDAEVMYLLIRDTLSETVVEISPRDGWSSLWILKALHDNDKGRLFGKGRLLSYDLLDTSTRFIPDELAEYRSLVVGDVREQPEQLPDKIDFLLMDSAHNGRFARWYVANVIPRVKDGAPIIIHDIQQHFIRHIPGTESHFIRKLLSERGVNAFSMSSLDNEMPDWLNRQHVMSLRRIIGLDQVPLHEAKGNLLMSLNRTLLRSIYAPGLVPDQRSRGNSAIFLRASDALTQSTNS